jgi:undecaprenyl-diphosphatase
MSEIVQSLILGIIQGLTEFLPVSSSGHLEIFKFFFGEKYTPEESLMLTVILHVATALSTIFIFRKDIVEILVGLFDKSDPQHRIFAMLIILSMIPAAIIGLVWEDAVEMLFQGNLFLVGGALIFTAILLFWSDQKKENRKSVTWFEAIIIGIAQTIAIIPGISRSGATIGTSVLLGIDRSQAATFSFLMVVPLILGKISKDMLDGSLANHSSNVLALMVGFVAAFITGALACTWMINWVKRSKLKYFAYYCFVIGLFLIIYWFV